MVNDTLAFVLVFLLGFAAGVVILSLWRAFWAKQEASIVTTLFEQSQQQYRSALAELEEKMRATFGSLSLDALGKSTDEFLKLATTAFTKERNLNVGELEGKKALIDGQLQLIGAELQKMAALARDLEKDRVEKFAELAQQLKMNSEITNSLMQTTGALKEALSSSQRRGQWGERMAEDVLRVAGLVEGINYTKQMTMEGSGKRPDFTFMLPNGAKINMDVKFPLDNYLRFLEAGTEREREQLRRDFANDVKAKLKEITSREYIDPGNGTVDYALCFIPNEQVFAFIYESASEITEEALKNKVIICSPLTVFAVLALIRQATENFVLGKTTDEILALLGAFHKQWQIFCEKMEGLGSDIGRLQKNYESLLQTRRRALERSLNKIEDIREQRNIEVSFSQED